MRITEAPYKVMAEVSAAPRESSLATSLTSFSHQFSRLFFPLKPVEKYQCKNSLPAVLKPFTKQIRENYLHPAIFKASHSTGVSSLYHNYITGVPAGKLTGVLNSQKLNCSLISMGRPSPSVNSFFTCQWGVSVPLYRKGHEQLKHL